MSQANGNQSEATIAVNPTNPLNIFVASNPNFTGQFSIDGAARLGVRWPLGAGCSLHLLANLADVEAPVPAPPPGEVLYCSHAPADALPAWSVRVSLERP